MAGQVDGDAAGGRAPAPPCPRCGRSGRRRAGTRARARRRPTPARSGCRPGSTSTDSRRTVGRAVVGQPELLGVLVEHRELVVGDSVPSWAPHGRLADASVGVPRPPATRGTVCPTHPSTSTSPTRRSTTARSPGSCSNRPEARNAQNRGLLVELDEAFLRGRGRRHRARRDPRRRRARCSRRATTWARKVQSRGACPGPTSTRRRTINGGTREGAENLMLQEWHYFFQNTLRWRNLRKITIAQVHGAVYAAGLMLMWACDLIVARRGRRSSPTSSAPASACAASSTSPTRGSSAPARPRSSCSPATRIDGRRGPPARHGAARSSRADELGRAHARVRPPHRQAARR